MPAIRGSSASSTAELTDVAICWLECSRARVRMGWRIAILWWRQEIEA